MDRKYLKESEIAEILGRSIHTLRADRSQNRGLPYIKLGHQVLYPMDRVEEYLQEHTVEPESK